MLRGQGTLQQLLGRPNFGKKPKGKRKLPAPEAPAEGGEATPAQAAKRPKLSEASGSKPKSTPKQQLLFFAKTPSSAPNAASTHVLSRQASVTKTRARTPGPSSDPAIAPIAAAAVAEPEAAVPPPPVLPDRPGWTLLFSHIVGLRHRKQLSATDRSEEASCTLRRQPDNPMDRNAIQVVQQDGGGEVHAIGFVMADVSRHLAPLMDREQLECELHVHFESQSRATFVPMTLYCRPCVVPPSPLAAAASPTAPSPSASRRRPDLDKFSPAAALLLAEAANAAAMLARGEPVGRVLRDKFLAMVDELRLHDARLFDSAELAMMACFSALGAPAQCLFLRLHMRRGPWFQIGRLRYAEVPDADAAVTDLVTHAVAARSSTPHDCSSLLDLLGADAARQLAASACAVAAGPASGSGRRGSAAQQRPVRVGGTKADALGALRRQLAAGGPGAAMIEAACEAALGACVRLTPAVVLLMERMQRIYFLSEAQDVSRFLATHVGAIKYPTYRVSPREVLCHAAFDTRSELLAYEAAVRFAARLEDCLQDDDWAGAADALTPVWEAIRGGAHMRVRWIVAGDGGDAGAVPLHPPGTAAAATAAAAAAATIAATAATPTCVPSLGGQFDLTGDDGSVEAGCGGTISARSPGSGGRAIGASGRDGACGGGHATGTPHMACTVRVTAAPEAGSPGCSEGLQGCAADPTELPCCSEQADPAAAAAAAAAAAELTLMPPAVAPVVVGSAAAGATAGGTSITEDDWADTDDGDDDGEAAAAAPTLVAVCSSPAGFAPTDGAPSAAPRASNPLLWFGESPKPKPLYLARFCAAWVCADMATVGVSMLERQKAHREAVELLQRLLEGACCPSRRGDWWQRLSIDREHIGDGEGALCACEAALQDPWVRNGDRLALQRRALRLGKPPRRWKRPTWATAAMAEPPVTEITADMVPGNVTGVKSQFHTLDVGGDGPALVGVEALCLQHYATPEGGGWTGVHTEGGAWATLFGLLMWDLLFGDDCSPPGVFRSPFQTAPLDLDTDAFYPARKTVIDRRLAQVADGEAPELLAAVWTAHHGAWCRGVAWEQWTLPTLQDICRCVGGLGLSVVLRLQAEDYRGWRGGMPDLLLWRPAVRDAMMVEVKGPRDRLSDQQRAWLLAVRAVDVPAIVLRVLDANAPGAKKGLRPTAARSVATPVAAPTAMAGVVVAPEAAQGGDGDLAAASGEEEDDDCVCV